MKNINWMTLILAIIILPFMACYEDSTTTMEDDDNTFILKARKGPKGKPSPYVVKLIEGEVNSRIDGNAAGNQLYTQFENGSIIIPAEFLIPEGTDPYDIDSLSKGAQFSSFEINQEGRVVTTQFWIADSKGRGFASPVLTVNVDEQGPETIEPVSKHS